MSIIIYTSPTCYKCHMTKEYLKSKGLKFTEKDVTDPAVLKELLNKTSATELPILEINGKIISGYKPGEIEKCMKQ